MLKVSVFIKFEKKEERRHISFTHALLLRNIKMSNKVIELFNSIPTTSSSSSEVTSNSLYNSIRDIGKILVSVKKDDVSDKLSSIDLWDRFQLIFKFSNITFGNGLRNSILLIYQRSFTLIPSYFHRTLISSLLSLTEMKLTISARDCLVYMIGKLCEEWGKGFSSTAISIIGTFSRIIKSYDMSMSLRVSNADLAYRATLFESIARVVLIAPNDIGELHVDLVKLASKWMTDKVQNVRCAIALLLKNIVIKSNGCNTITLDAIIAVTNKGINDNIINVASDFSLAAATAYVSTIRAFRENEERTRAGQARGGANSVESITSDASNQSKSITTKFKEVVSIRKKLVESHDLKTIIQYLVIQIIKSNSSFMRITNVSILEYLITDLVDELLMEELQWFLETIHSSLHNPTVLALPDNEIMQLQFRLSNMIRKAIFSKCGEEVHTQCATSLLKSLKSGHTQSYELAFIMNELSHLINILKESAVPLIEGAETEVLKLLRHDDLLVRISAVYLVVSLGTAVPLNASRYFRDALSAAKSQAKLLMSTENSGDTVDSLSKDSRKSSSIMKEMLKRMYLMHGQTLLLSQLMKHSRKLPSGLPNELVIDALEFGLSLLAFNVSSVEASLRPIAYSIMKSGSAIASAALSIGYTVIHDRVPSILGTIKFLITVIETSRRDSSTSNGQNKSKSKDNSDHAPEELVCIESTLVVMSALLWFCPESLRLDDQCLPSVVSALEKIWKTMKTKYISEINQSGRAQSIYTLLLECFSWLPMGSFPNTLEQMFDQALNTFTFCVKKGIVSKNLTDFLDPISDILMSLETAKYGIQDSAMHSQSLYALSLIGNANCCSLEKRDMELHLASFVHHGHGAGKLALKSITTELETEVIVAKFPCVEHDSRLLNAAMGVLNVTFPFQSPQKQVDAILVSIKSSNYGTVSMFSSEEDREKHLTKTIYADQCVMTLFASILQFYPSIMINTIDEWLVEMINYLTTSLDSSDVKIKLVAASTIGSFCVKAVDTGLLNSVANKLTGAVKGCLEKELKSPSSAQDNVPQDLNVMSGQVMALAACATCHVPSAIRMNIISLLFACLKLKNLELKFRSYLIFALATVLKQIPMGASTDDRDDLVAIVKTSYTLLNLQMSAELSIINHFSDKEVYYRSMQVLLNITISLSLQLIPVNEESRTMYDDFTQIWTVIKDMNMHVGSLRESFTFLHCIASFPRQGNRIAGCVDLNDALNFILPLFKKRDYIYIDSYTIALEVISMICSSFTDWKWVDDFLIDVYILLDWCNTSNLSSVASPHHTIDYQSIALDTTRRLSGLEDSCLALLESMMMTMITTDPEREIVHWLLLSKSIFTGTNLRRKKVLDQQSDLDDMFDADEVKDGTGAEVNSTAQKVTLADYLTWRRDNTPSLYVSPCVRTKSHVLKSMNTAFQYLYSKKADHVDHFDATVAKHLFNKAASTTMDNDIQGISRLPAHLVLFLQDAVSLACAAATFTIEDHHPDCLQIEAADLLSVIIDLFWESKSCSDIIKSSKDHVPGENSVLELYVPQIVAALRPCLLKNWQPRLLRTACTIGYNLIRGKYIPDDLVAKRLLKSMYSSNAGEDNNFEPRAMSYEVADNIAIEFKTVNAGNLAMLFCLGYDPIVSMYVDNSCKQMIKEFLGEDLWSKLDVLWFASIIDGLRALQGYSHWPGVTPISEPSRGGVLYPPVNNYDTLRKSLLYVLPITMLAMSHIHNKCTTRENIKEILMALIQGMMPYLLDDEAYHDDVGTAHYALLPSYIWSAAAILAKNNPSDTSDSWDLILTFLSSNYLPRVIADGKKGDNNLLNYLLVINVLSTLSTQDALPESLKLKIKHNAFQVTVAILPESLSDVILLNDNIESFSKSCIRKFLMNKEGTSVSSSASFTQLKEIIPKLMSILSGFEGMETVQVVLYVKYIGLTEITEEKLALLNEINSDVLSHLQTDISKQMILLQDIYNEFGETTNNTAIGERLEIYIEGLLGLWGGNLLDNQVKLPFELVGILLEPSKSSSNLKNIFTRAVTRLLQWDPTNCGSKVVALVLPPLLQLFIKQDFYHISLEAFARLAIAASLAVPTPKIGQYFSLILPAFGYALHSRPADVNEGILFCGTTLAHFATSHPNAFRTHVATIEERYRMSLMGVMKQALTNASNAAAGGITSPSQLNSNAHGHVKKIDFNKYKK